MILVKTVFQEWYEKTEMSRICPTSFDVIGDVQCEQNRFVLERAHWSRVGRLKTAAA